MPAPPTSTPERARRRTSRPPKQSSGSGSSGASPAGGPAAADSKDIWTLAESAAHKSSAAGDERTVLFVGSKGAGKSTLILNFLERREETPKPTMALEYSFGRKTRGQDLGRDLVHVWELGGGTFLRRLVETPITPSTLRGLGIVMVLDLSKPDELWHTMEALLDELRTRLDHVLSELSARDPRIPQHMRKKALLKYGEDCADISLLTPLPVPLVIVGSKYDVFRDFEPEKRKTMCRALRFVAHTHGASLLFSSERDPTLLNRCRGVISYLAFRTRDTTRSVCFDHDKPLIIPAGSDSLATIGAPPSVDGVAAGRGPAPQTPLALWRRVYELFCGSAPSAPMAGDPTAEAGCAEATIDAMRREKDEELERYRRRAERRAKELAQKRDKRTSTASAK